MKKGVLLTLVIFALTFTHNIFAAQEKVGVIDTLKVISSAPQFNQAQKKLKAQFKSREDNLLKAQKNLTQTIDRYNQKTSNLNKLQKMKAQKNIKAEEKALYDLQRSFSTDFNKTQRETMDSVLKNIHDVVVNIAKEQKFNLIIDQRSIAYHDENLDITNSVIDVLKKPGK